MELSFEELVAAVHAAAVDDSALEHLRAAAHLSGAVTDTADALLSHFVDQARDDGRSWAEIGAALGVSKQAAQKRFVGSALRRLTPRAQRVLEVAREIADDQGAAALRLDHLALALFSDPDAIATRVLDGLGITESALQAEITRRIHARGARLCDEPPVDRLVLAAALDLGHNYLGTEHMLLACHREPRSLMARVLAELGASEATLRERTLVELGHPSDG